MPCGITSLTVSLSSGTKLVETVLVRLSATDTSGVSTTGPSPPASFSFSNCVKSEIAKTAGMYMLVEQVSAKGWAGVSMAGRGKADTAAM